MKGEYVEPAPKNRSQEFEDGTDRWRSALRRALLAEEQEIDSLEKAVRGLRARHLDLQETFDRAVAEQTLEPDLISLPATVRLAFGMPAREELPPPEPAPHESLHSQALHEAVPLPDPPAPSEASDEKVLSEARRFARLLVSEIVLYHGAAVEEGRREGGLYARLKSPIERSRRAYEQRFAKSAAGSRHFFDEEVLATLALDDAVLLGAGYPGSLE